MYRTTSTALKFWSTFAAMIVLVGMVSIALAQGSGSKPAGSANKTQQKTDAEKVQVKAELNAQALKAIMDAKVPMLLLDARGPSDQLIGNAVPLSYDSDEKAIDKVVTNANQLIVTYCSGPECPMSLMLANRLAKKGYTNVIRFTGGIEAWTAAGFKLKKKGKMKGSISKAHRGSSSKPSGSGTR